MNLTNWQESDRAALKAFYSVSGHLWSWAEMEAGTTSAARTAREWIESGPPPRLFPVLLPRVTTAVDNTTNVIWYAVAFNQAQCEQLRSELWAYVGPVATDFDRRCAEVNASDEAEVVLSSWVGGQWFFRITVKDNTKKDWLRNALNRLRFVWGKRPIGRPTRFRTTEELLRDFHASLTNLDESSSDKWLQELKDGGRLSAENLLFLQIERLATFGRWEELFLHPQWSLLRQLRRPRQVTARMIEAIYQVKLAPFIERKEPAEAVAFFRDKVLPENGAIFRNRGQANSRPVLLAFILAAAAGEQPQRDKIIGLLSNIPEATPERFFGQSVLALISEGVEKLKGKELEFAKRAVANNDYDGAWELLKKLTPSVDTVRLMLVCAYEFDTLEAAETVNSSLQTIGEQSSALVFKNNRTVLRNWDELKKRLKQSPPPTDWESWLKRLDAQPDWTEAVATACDGAAIWSLDIYKGNQNRVIAVADKLFADRSDSARRSLRTALPNLAGFFIPNGLGNSEFRPIYANLLMLSVLTEDFSTEDFSFVQTLLEAILDSGATARVYEDAVQTCVEIWQTFGSVYTLDWALETLDILASRPTSAPQARDRFFEVVLASFQKDHRRVSSDQWDIFSWLSKDLGRGNDFSAICPTNSVTGTPGTPSDQHRESLADKTVAIYTLTQSAGERAKKMIQQMFLGVDVQLTTELVGSASLKALSRRADWFIVATRSAKHAATEFIKQSRPPGKTELLYPTGKGASSIVGTLLKAVGATSN